MNVAGTVRRGAERGLAVRQCAVGKQRCESGSDAPHWPDPPPSAIRIAEIRDNLTARITEADREGWLGEAEGLNRRPRQARPDRSPHLRSRPSRARNARPEPYPRHELSTPNQPRPRDHFLSSENAESSALPESRLRVGSCCGARSARRDRRTGPMPGDHWAMGIPPLAARRARVPACAPGLSAAAGLRKYPGKS